MKWKKRDLLLLAIKLIEKISDATNAKQNCPSYLKRKNKHKIGKTIKNNDHKQLLNNENFEKPNTADKRSVTIYRTSKNFT